MGDFIQSINDASVPFLVWVQGFQADGLTGFFKLMSWLGLSYFYVLFFPLIYWSISKRWGIMAAFALLVADYVGMFVKWTFKLPRPPSPPVNHLWSETSPGFVSTHASTSLAFWGTLAVLVRRWWMTLLALFIILSIALSRLYLGVHFPADVIGGWLVGLFAMWAVLWGIPRLTPRVKKWSAGQQIGGVFAVAVIFLVITPSNWEGMRPDEAFVRDAAMLGGALLGLIWDQHRLKFSVAGGWGQRLLRYLIGIVLVIAAFFGLSALFSLLPLENYYLDQTLRLIRYGLVGFVITGLAPWLFLRLGLAQESTK